MQRNQTANLIGRDKMKKITIEFKRKVKNANDFRTKEI